MNNLNNQTKNETTHQMSSIKADHSFTPDQQVLILNAVQEIIEAHGGALIFYSQLEAIHQDNTRLQLKENDRGDVIYKGSIEEFEQTAGLFSDLKKLCLEIDIARSR